MLPISMAAGLIFNYLFLFLELRVIAEIVSSQKGDSGNFLPVLLIAAAFLYVVMTLSILVGCFLIGCAFRHLAVPKYKRIVVTASLVLPLLWFNLIKFHIVESNTTLLGSIISFAVVYEVLFYFYNRK